MSGGLSCAIDRPSMYSTMEWTIDCGWITTPICSGAQVEQPAGLDDLQGLVHQRGRVDRDLRAHVPGGMGQGLGRPSPRPVARRCRCETARRWPSAPPGAPPPDAPPAGPGTRRCARCRPAGCGPRFCRASRVTSGPATTRLSLLARATVLPASRAAQVPSSPARPTIAETRRRPPPRPPPGSRPRARRAPRPPAAAPRPVVRGGRLRVGHHDPARPRPTAPAAAKQLRVACRPPAPPPGAAPRKRRSPPGAAADAPGGAQHGDIGYGVSHVVQTSVLWVARDCCIEPVKVSSVGEISSRTGLTGSQGQGSGQQPQVGNEG